MIILLSDFRVSDAEWEKSGKETYFSRLSEDMSNQNYD